MRVQAYIPQLKEIQERIVALLEQEGIPAAFNCVLANLYRDGRDSNGWHADDEKELGQNPLIASLSLGTQRRFDLRHKLSKEKISLELEPGSLLVMGGEMQHYWKHQVAKSTKITAPRINLTFRKIS